MRNVVGFRFPDDAEMEVWRPEDVFHDFFGPVQHSGAPRGAASAGRTGTSTRSSRKKLDAPSSPKASSLRLSDAAGAAVAGERGGLTDAELVHELPEARVVHPVEVELVAPGGDDDGGS